MGYDMRPWHDGCVLCFFFLCFLAFSSCYLFSVVIFCARYHFCLAFFAGSLSISDLTPDISHLDIRFNGPSCW